MRESEIAYETPCGRYWVHNSRQRNAYVVFKAGPTCSISDSAYALDDDGLSIAKARADYLAGEDAKLCAG